VSSAAIVSRASFRAARAILRIMPNYRRWRVPGGCYFFTVNLLNRRRTLLVDHIDVLRDAFRRVQEAQPFHIDAAVILPDHLHCIWTLPEGDSDFSGRWGQIKKRFSRALPRGENRSLSRERRRERGIWQRRFWEQVIRDEEDFARHVDYIHFNPVKHGLCQTPAQWPHSSLRDWIRRGVLPSDWGTSGAVGLASDLDIE
jgi:putative transposase